jgi:hypothetical protein
VTLYRIAILAAFANGPLPRLIAAGIAEELVGGDDFDVSVASQECAVLRSLGYLSHDAHRRLCLTDIGREALRSALPGVNALKTAIEAGLS